jgi:hypothetical protein
MQTGHVISASIDRITTDGQFTEFSIPLANLPGAITAGPDGNLWFTEPDANQIGMITPDGQITEFAVPTANSRPEFITAGPDGNLWFTEPGSAQIGEFVLNASASTGASAAPATPAAIAPATSFLSVAAPIPGSLSESLPPLVVNQQPTLPAADAVTTPETRYVDFEAGIMHYQHKPHQAEAADAAGLADAFAEGLAQTT